MSKRGLAVPVHLSPVSTSRLSETLDGFHNTQGYVFSNFKSQFHGTATPLDPKATVEAAAKERQSEAGSDGTRPYEVWCVSILFLL